MRSFLHFRWLLALVLIFGSWSAAQATHMRGGDITYASIASTTAGVPRYHVVVRQFYETGGAIVSPSSAVSLTASKAGCSISPADAFTVSAPMTQLLNSALQTCSPVGAAYTIGIYEIDIDLPAAQWQLSTVTSARSAAIQNLVSPTSESIYLIAHLDNTVTTQDISPIFQSMLQPNVSASALTPFSFSAFDANGDSLRYEVMQPLGGCSVSLPYTSGFTPHYTINASTGLLTPTSSSSTQGYYNITVRVSEYRKMGANRWTLIGDVMRDTIYLLYPTTNQAPTFTTMQVNGGPTQAFGPAIVAQAGQTVNVVIQATDPDVGQTLRYTSAAAGLVPGLSLAPISGTTAAQLIWQLPANLPAGRYPVLVTVIDNGCSNASEERVILFIVGNSAALATRASATATDVYPVPFREQVQFTTAPNQAVILVDALGREVARLTSAADGLVRWQPADTLPAGLYLARSAASGQPLARLLRAE